MSGTKISSVLRQNLFKGKVAIVTGGATGIGNAITKELLYLGKKRLFCRKFSLLESQIEIIDSQVVASSLRREIKKI